MSWTITSCLRPLVVYSRLREGEKEGGEEIDVGWETVWIKESRKQEAGSAVLRSGGVTGEWAQRNGMTGLKNEMLIKDLAGGLNALSQNILSVSLSVSLILLPSWRIKQSTQPPEFFGEMEWGKKETLAFESFLLNWKREVFVKWLQTLKLPGFSFLSFSPFLSPIRLRGKFLWAKIKWGWRWGLCSLCWLWWLAY